MERWSTPLQWLCEVAGYWQELEHAVVYADPEHPKHAQWVTCPVSMLAKQELGCFQLPGIVYRSLHHGAVHYHAATWGDGREVRWWFRKPVSIWCDQHLPSPLHRVLWTIFERNRPFVYIEKVLDLWVQLMKNGGKNKSVAFIFLFSVYIYCHLSFSRRFYPKWLTNEDNGSNQNQQKCNDMQVL